MDPCLPSLVALNENDHPATQLVHPFRQVEGSHARDAWTVRGLALESLVKPTPLFKDISAASARAPHRLCSRLGLSITSNATQSLGAPEDLPKQAAVPHDGQIDARGPP